MHGHAASEPLPVVTSGYLTLANGEQVEIDDDLLMLINGIVGQGLVGRRARVEVTPELVTPEEAAELLEVSRPTIYNWQNAGVLGRVEMKNRRMVPISDVEAVRAAQTARHAVDATFADVDEDEVPLSDLEYRKALAAARASGVVGALAEVRRRQRAARATEASKRARAGEPPVDRA
ncbi:MAG: helix-turn-helix domain-containing protein [Actinomycetes bacterium]